MDLLILAGNISEFIRPFNRAPRSFGFGPFETITIQILIVIAALFILWWMLRSHYKNNRFNKSDTPLDILNKRYAAGEITKEIYEQLKKDIGA